MPAFFMMRAKGSEIPLQYGMEMCPRCLCLSGGAVVVVVVVVVGSWVASIVGVVLVSTCAPIAPCVVLRSRCLPLLYVSSVYPLAASSILTRLCSAALACGVDGILSALRVSALTVAKRDDRGALLSCAMYWPV